MDSTPPGVRAPRFSTVAARLYAAGCIAAEDEARELIAAAPRPDALEAALARRERGEPLAWITGGIEFCGRPLRVDPGVYVPRAQSEELARRAAGRLPGGGRAIDLCTGAGAIAAHIQAQVPTASVFAIDIDPVAVACATTNGVRAALGDLTEPPPVDGPFDVVTAVPPYVPTGELRLLPPDITRHEPLKALDGGPDGLDVARRVVAAAALLLAPGGWMFIELGGNQDALLAPDLEAHAFRSIETWHDGEGDLRGLAARSEPHRDRG